MNQLNEEKQNKLQHDLQNESFADCADNLRIAKNYSEAIRVCLEGLSSNPEFDRGRLVLARIYYDCGYIDFSLRELAYIYQKCPDNIYVKRLMDYFKRAKKPSKETSIIISDFIEKK